MNAVICSVAIMLILAICRVHIVLSLTISAIIGGLLAGMSIEDTLKIFNDGLAGGASVALSYALLGAFAVAISKSGLANYLAKFALDTIKQEDKKDTAIGAHHVKWVLITFILLASIFSQNLIPIHVAFIPIIIPPLLPIFDKLKLDRRALACVMTFGLITPYMFAPIGFGEVFLKRILLQNISDNGVDIESISVMGVMLIPALGMLCGLLIAVFISYKKERLYYSAEQYSVIADHISKPINTKVLVISLVAIVSAFIVQLLFSDSMILGAMMGFLIFSLSGVIEWRQADNVFNEGMKMLAMMGFILIAASGFANVMKATGSIEYLVKTSVDIIGNSRSLGAFLMLVIGLLITMGIGSAFSTIPIITTIFVPLSLELGFSAAAIVAIIGTAGALGDAGSPASDSTLGPSAGLNIDGKHDHIRDTVIPTFLHYNLPLIIFGWIAAMVL